MDHDDNDSDNDVMDLPSSHPAAVMARNNKRRRGWQGEEMELEHQQGDISRTNVAAAVDLSQFQNTEVGVGYQARHVVRQRTAETAHPPLSSGERKAKKQKHTTSAASSGNGGVVAGKDEFLQNCGLRAFRREIETILSSTS
mmetsp:Transcript_6000/g.11151  ORF Transcript_6000/g.11151 Transcript_6000/m.11151 type:complete len:142 (+) Transcript_6000:278-703(+)